MAYNNIFPTTYQPMSYAPQAPVQQVPVQTAPAQNGPMIWVQGEASAKSYLLAPNTTLPLWDSENQVIYLKSTDASGMPSMKVLDYTIRDTDAAHVPAVVASEEDYVTQEEFKKFEKSIRSQIRSLSKKEEKENE